MIEHVVNPDDVDERGVIIGPEGRSIARPEALALDPPCCMRGWLTHGGRHETECRDRPAPSVKRDEVPIDQLLEARIGWSVDEQVWIVP